MLKHICLLMTFAACGPVAYGQASIDTRPSSSSSLRTGYVYVTNDTLMSVKLRIDHLIDDKGKKQTFEGVSWTISPGTTRILRKGTPLRGREVEITFRQGDVSSTYTARKLDTKGRLTVTIDDGDLHVEKVPSLKASERDSFRRALENAKKESGGSTSKRDDLIAEAIGDHAEDAAESKAAREGISKTNSRYKSFLADAAWEYAYAFHGIARQEVKGKQHSSITRAATSSTKPTTSVKTLAEKERDESIAFIERVVNRTVRNSHQFARLNVSMSIDDGVLKMTEEAELRGNYDGDTYKRFGTVRLRDLDTQVMYLSPYKQSGVSYAGSIELSIANYVNGTNTGTVQEKKSDGVSGGQRYKGFVSESSILFVSTAGMSAKDINLLVGHFEQLIRFHGGRRSEPQSVVRSQPSSSGVSNWDWEKRDGPCSFCKGDGLISGGGFYGLGAKNNSKKCTLCNGTGRRVELRRKE